MGQRLNIEIKRKSDNKVLANSYYHWSAYTYPSLKLANEIIENIDDIIRKEQISDEIKAVQLLQTTGAGLMQDEYNMLSEENKKYCSVSTSRNLGLISLSDKGMEETRTWEEGRLTIVVDFDTKEYNFRGDIHRVDFEVYMPINSDEINEYYEEEIKRGKLDLYTIPQFDFDLQDMDLQDIRLFLSRINDIENNCGIFINNDNYYQIIY